MWSDESTFTQFLQAHTSRVWREPEDEWSIFCAAATVKHSPSRMHWGCFSRKGVGPIVPLYESVTGTSHVKILRYRVLPTMRRMFPKGDGLFQKDNAPPHKSKVAGEFRKKKGLVVLSWPAQALTSTLLRTCGLRSNEACINVCQNQQTLFSLKGMSGTRGGRFRAR